MLIFSTQCSYQSLRTLLKATIFLLYFANYFFLYIEPFPVGALHLFTNFSITMILRLSLPLSRNRLYQKAPNPSIHRNAFDFGIFSFLSFENTEPIGSSAPKVPKVAKSNDFYEVSGDEISLLCPAQGYPTPGFR